MSTALSLPPARNHLAEDVVDKAQSIVKALPVFVSKQQFATTLVVTCNQLDVDKISDSKSVLISAFNCAAIGLIPGSQLGHAYMIPRKGRCNLEIGYRGFLELAFRNKHLSQVYGDVVLQGEEFDYWVTTDGPQIMHRPLIDRDPTQARQTATHAYCVYGTTVGGKGLRVLSRSQLNKIDSQKHVWLSDYFEMARKSALRRAAKDWNCVTQMLYAIDLDEKAELGIKQELLPGVEDAIEEGKTSFSLDDIPDEEEE